MHNFRELSVWQRSMELVVMIYNATDLFPTKEKFGIINQLRRCSVSIPSNIAEGSGRDSEKEFRYFISISIGSLFELETQVLLSKKLQYLNNDKSLILIKEIREIQRMLIGLKKRLQ